MYSRAKDRENQPIQIPKQYSGCAFSEHRPPFNPSISDATDMQEASFIPILTHPPASTEALSAPLPPPPTHQIKPPPRPSIPLPQPFQHLFGGLGHSFPFSHGLGFDELLLIGLMVLLASNGDHDPDILLYLGLLLFCG